ncbi:MAG: CoA synthetase [Alphaproteobacteria bacterium]|nr:CoA synthetase [Alphaproteobacteria bacterium]
MDAALIAGSVQELVAAIPDGALLCVPRDGSGVAMAATRALLRGGVGNLHLLAVPSSGIQADLLIGAGRVAVVEAAGITLGEYGLAPAFNRAVRGARVRLLDATCPAIHASLQAAEKGLPFMPLRGLIGSDLVRHRPDWRQIDNPFGQDDPIVLLPACRPDISLFHAALADRQGNVWVGRDRECMTMAHAAKTTLVTVEEIVEFDLMADARYAPGTLPGLYVERIAVASRGAWPLGLTDRYPPDGEHLRLYARAAASEEGFARYLEEQVHGRRAAAE